MKQLSILLITISFLAGAFVTSLDATLVNWTWFLPILFIGIVGVALLKRTTSGEAKSEEKLSGNINVLQTSLNNIVRNLNELNDQRENLPTYEARFEIDRRFRDDLHQFAEARQSMVHIFGLQQYANVMSAFAAGERYINRVWSASTDGYVDEVKMYLEKATSQFNEAHALFEKLRESTDA